MQKLKHVPRAQVVLGKMQQTRVAGFANGKPHSAQFVMRGLDKKSWRALRKDVFCRRVPEAVFAQRVQDMVRERMRDRLIERLPKKTRKLLQRQRR